VTLSRRLGFHATLTLSFGVLCVLTIGVLVLSLTRVIERRLAAQQGEALQSLARGTSIMLAEGLYDRIREVQLLAESPEAARSGLDPAVWRPILQRMQATRPHFAWIGITNEHGVVQSATGGLLQGQDVSARPWFQAARQGVHVGDVHAAKLLAAKLPPGADGEPMRFVDFAAPLRAADGRLLGVLGVHGSWDWAREVIDALRSKQARDNGILIFIVDVRGDVLHRPLGPAGAGAVPDVADLLPQARVLHWDDGVEYLTAAARLPPRTATTALDWTIVVRQPVHQALYAAAQAARVAWWAGLATLAVGLAGVWWLAGYVSAPLRRIARAAQRVGDGDLDSRIPQERQAAEVADLADSVRAMAATLIRQKTDLQAANSELEQRVAERTADLEGALAELARLARHDPVTGLHNRRGADERLAQELALYRRHGTVFSILLADIDRFKQVNDQHGHDVGDQVLAETARRMGLSCRRTDLLCRYGGEEFLLVMAHTDAQGGAAAAEKIRAQVAAAPIGPLQQVTVSIGVATVAPGLLDAAPLVKAADQALYAAKRNGRNRVEVAGVEAVPIPAAPDAMQPLPASPAAVRGGDY
jgi:diguanylate cyclase (GGDEF)-like protein